MEPKICRVSSSGPHRWFVCVTGPIRLITIPTSTPCELFRMMRSPLLIWGHFRRIALKDGRVMPQKPHPGGILNLSKIAI